MGSGSSETSLEDSLCYSGEVFEPPDSTWSLECSEALFLDSKVTKKGTADGNCKRESLNPGLLLMSEGYKLLGLGLLFRPSTGGGVYTQNTHTHIYIYI